MSPESFEGAMEGFLVGVPARKGVRCECFDGVFFFYCVMTNNGVTIERSSVDAMPVHETMKVG